MFREVSIAIKKVKEQNKFGLVNWELTRRLTERELGTMLRELKDSYAGTEAELVSSGNTYKIKDVSVLNISGKAFISIDYVPYRDNIEMLSNRHTRPATEFFDGRFKLSKN